MSKELNDTYLGPSDVINTVNTFETSVLPDFLRQRLYGRHLVLLKESESHLSQVEHEDEVPELLLQSGIHAIHYGYRTFGVERLTQALEHIDISTKEGAVAAMRANRMTAKAYWRNPVMLDDAEKKLRESWLIGLRYAVKGTEDFDEEVGLELGATFSFQGRLKARKYGYGVLASLEESLAKLESAEDELSMQGVSAERQANLNYLSFINLVAGNSGAALESMKKSMALGRRDWDDYATWIFIGALLPFSLSEESKKKIIRTLVR